MIESLERPYWQPKQEKFYFVRNDLRLLLERPERGILKHYITNLIEMKKHSYFERELEEQVVTASKDTITKFLKAYKEIKVLVPKRFSRRIGFELPCHFPSSMEDWPNVDGGYLKLNTKELKGALKLTDNGFRVFVLMRYLGLSFKELTARILKKAFSFCLKTVKAVVLELKIFLFKKEENKEKSVRAVNALDLLNQKLKEFRSKASRGMSKKHKNFETYGLKEINIPALLGLVKEGIISEKELRISLRRFSEWYFSTVKKNNIKNPNSYIYSVLKKEGRFIPPEEWIFNQNRHEKGGKMVAKQSVFDEEMAFQNQKRKAQGLFLEHIRKLNNLEK